MSLLSRCIILSKLSDRSEFEGLDANTKQSIIAKRVAKHHREMREKSDTERYILLRDMDAADKQIRNVSALYRNPVVMLQREGLGTEQRSRYMDQLRNSGPAELEAMAQLAANTGNAVLAASVLSTIDGIKTKNERDAVNVSRDELSYIMVGDQFENSIDHFPTSRSCKCLCFKE